MTISQTMRLEDKVSPVFSAIEKNAAKVLNEFKRLDNEHSKLTQAASQVRAEFGEHNKLYRELTNSARAYGDKIKELVNSGHVDDITDDLTKAKEIQDKLTGSINKSSDAMRMLHGIAQKVAAVFGIRSLMNMSDTMVQTEARLGLALSGNNWAGTSTQLADSIFTAARRSRSSYDTMAGTVSKLGMQAGDAFSGAQELVDFTENLSKIFKVSGLDSMGIQSVMYNLTQSMSTGHLLGNDYRILKMNAPELIKMLRDTYANGSQESLDKMVSDGQITSEMLKRAILNNTDEIEKKFKEMPVTWNDVWTHIKDDTGRILKPVLKIVSSVAKVVDNSLTWIEDHWRQLQPLITTGIILITVALTALLGKKIANTAATAISTVSAYLEAEAFLASAAAAELQATAEGKATVAAIAHSVAMTKLVLILLIVVGIIILVAYTASWVAEKVTGESVNALGLILGSVFVVFGTIYNAFVGLIGEIIAIINTTIEPIIFVFEFILNVINGGFDSFGDAVANLIGNIIGWFLNLGKVVTTIIDAIFGTNWTSGLESLQNDVRAWGQNENAATLDRNVIENPLQRASIYDQENGLFYKGYNAGKGFSEEMAKAFDTSSINDALTTDSAGNTAINTTTGDSLLSDEDMQLLLDIATRDFKLNYQQITPEISVTFTGDIRETADVEGIYETIVTEIEEGLNNDLEVVAI